MTLVALPRAVVSYSTCDLVTSVTLTPGAETGWRGKYRMRCGAVYVYIYIYIYIYIYSFSALCVFCLHVSHTMVHNQVYSACSVCVLAEV